MKVSGPLQEDELRQGFRTQPGDQTLVDLLDRAIDRGVVIVGDVVLSVAGVDLVHVELRVRIQGVATQLTGAAEIDR